MTQSAPLTYEQQREIFHRLQQGLFSADPDKRQAARRLLDMFSGRQDLYQDVSQTVARWRTGFPTTHGVQPSSPKLPVAAQYSSWITPTPKRPSHQIGSAQGTSGLAIASLVASLIAFPSCGIGSIVGIVLGIVALNDIKQTHQAGYRLAVAAIAVGAAELVIILIFGVRNAVSE